MPSNVQMILYGALVLLSSLVVPSASRHYDWYDTNYGPGRQDPNGVDHYNNWDYYDRDSPFGPSRYRIAFSSPEECSRSCRDGEPPRYCYYKFKLEYYVTMTRACELCRPNNTNQLSNIPQCQCIEADGFERGMLAINRMLPGPSIQVCQNDRVVIDVENDMGGLEVALHWHGLWQEDFQYYDGVPFLTQCPIPSHTTFRYRFIASNAGTHFYHSHSGEQKIDGQYGSLIVRQSPSSDAHSARYDSDLPTHVILLSDWMHEMSVERFPGRYVRNRGQLPDNVLINGKGRWTDPATNITTTSQLESFVIEAGKRYRFRMINSFSSVCPAQMTIEGHSLTLIAQDGEDVRPVPVNTIISYSGERVDFVLNANRSTGAYWIQVRAIGECVRPRPHQVAILRYRGGRDTPTSPQPTYDTGLNLGVVYNPLDAICDIDRSFAICPNQLKSIEKVPKELLRAQPDHRIILPFNFFSYTSTNNIPKLFQPGTYRRFLVAEDGDHIDTRMDNIFFKFPSVPPLSQDITPADTCNRNRLPTNCQEPCPCPHTHDIRRGAIVEVVLYDEIPQPNLSHPFHLHGYAFRPLVIGRFADGRNISRSDINNIMNDHQKMLDSSRYSQPAGKDTLAVPQAGYIIFRFKADNPGWWLFHCHFLYHVPIGMNVIFHVGQKSDLPPVPKNFPTCGNFEPDLFDDFK